MGLGSLDCPGARTLQGRVESPGLVVSEICLPLPDTGACSVSLLVEFQAALGTGPAAYFE